MRATINVRAPAPLWACVAGLSASAAYLLAQSADMALTGNRYDDLLLWGGALAPDSPRRRMLGAVVHCLVGVTVAGVYDALKPSLPNLPRWVQGVLFVQAENTFLFPTVAVINRIHPLVRRGELPSLWTWRYFWIEAARHGAYGIVMGTAGHWRRGR